MPTSTLYITEMDCATEEQIIRNGLRKLPGITALDFNLMQREMVVEHDFPDPKPILEAVASLGMKPVLRDASALSGDPVEPGQHDRRQWIVLAASGIAATAAEVIEWTSGGEQNLLVAALAILSIALGGRDVLRKGWASLRTRTLNINLLMMIAVAGAVAIGHWPEAAMVTFLFALAETIEGYSLDRARNAIRSLMSMTPDTASVLAADGTFTEQPVEDVAIDQVVRVRAGERVPLDGVVTEGQSSVNQAPITGESLPVEKGPGDTVFAGTINEDGRLLVRVTANSGDTTLARIVRTIQTAQAQRAPTQRFVDQFARYYTPAVVVLAVLAAIVPPLLWGQPFAASFYNALVLLVIACPCALVLSTPITVVSGLTAAARRGILVKGGTHLEAGRTLKLVALDKTGTLTHGRPEVTDIVPLYGQSPAEVLRLAAELNHSSTHPVAAAMVRATEASAPAEGSAPPPVVTDFKALPGRGVEGRVDGTTWFVGSHRLAEERGACSPQVEEVLARLEAEGKTTVVLGDQRAQAVFGLADTLRPAGVQVVRELHALGVKTAMLTGDNAATARAIAATAGIDDVRPELLPEDKMRAVEALETEYGPVGMLGDGVNDAPALARATIGFAMGAAGSDTALETADVAILDDDLLKLPAFLRLSRRTVRILQQNITLALALKAVFFALALSGQATLWMAVFADMGGSLLVVLNGLRLLHGAEPTTPVAAARQEEARP
jgi:Cd2+/Zn2+-exporting ATPase